MDIQGEFPQIWNISLLFCFAYAKQKIDYDNDLLNLWFWFYRNIFDEVYYFLDSIPVVHSKFSS